MLVLFTSRCTMLGLHAVCRYSNPGPRAHNKPNSRTRFLWWTRESTSTYLPQRQHVKMAPICVIMKRKVNPDGLKASRSDTGYVLINKAAIAATEKGCAPPALGVPISTAEAFPSLGVVTRRLSLGSRLL